MESRKADVSAATILRDAGLSARHVPDGLGVSSPLFVQPDGDRAACYVEAREGGLYELTDASLCCLTPEDDSEAIGFARRFGVSYDESTGELLRKGLTIRQLPGAAFEFLVMVQRIQAARAIPPSPSSGGEGRG